ncbi:MAG: NAD(P)-dependent alcohol dehydrogenase [Gammaproteobacteria bacterium]|nr:NAD(P)-dependent alcohol dehydrogenase [Gammaproteobacteria bacterium]
MSQFERRDLTPHDVLIDIYYCGICHSDIHQVHNEWKNSLYPMVPGHEIVGVVTKIGTAVKRFQINDIVGIGCFVDSCRICPSCIEGEEQFCEKHVVLTYNSTEMDLTTRTFGGYSSCIVVDENYVLKISKQLHLANVAPLLCAGITTYSPLKRYNIGKKHKVAIAGLGGLGHMGVKFAAAMGAEVTVLSTSPSKENDAKQLGAKNFLVTTNSQNLSQYNNYFDFILNTVSASYDPNVYLNLLNRGGVMVIVGVPENPLSIQPFNLISKRRTVSGSLIGGIRETQEMLDFCAKNNITADVEIIPFSQIEEAYARTIKGKVHYRFVIDVKNS